MTTMALSSPEARLTVELMNVGHGDALAVHWRPAEGQPSTILIDGGPSGAETKIAATLRKLGASSIDLAVLTHCDADHIDGLLNYARLDDHLPIKRFWGPCVPAFLRHSWLFPPRVVRGLQQAHLLNEKLSLEGTVSWPVEGAEWSSPDGGLVVKVLSPAGRLVERLLVGNDTLELFLQVPMPVGWLFSPGEQAPIEDPFADLRASIATGEITPDRFPPLPPVERLAPADDLARQSAEQGLDPEFFGNSVLNDTSIVLLIEAQIGAVRRKLLFTGDLENFTYLMGLYPNGLGCEIVKAPHHGSRSFVGRDEAYDETWHWLRPQAVLVSANGKHGLPRLKFRNSVLRAGATLFCTNRRAVEIVSGALGATCCHEQFKCREQAPVSLHLTETDIFSEGVACRSGTPGAQIPIIEIRQHVVEPSSILENFSEGEIRQHVRWVTELLYKTHQNRISAKGESGLGAILSSFVRGEALADKRFRAAANITVVLERAARDGKIWLSRTNRYGDPERAAWIMPSASQFSELQAWINEFSIIQLMVPNRKGALVAKELLLEADVTELARLAAERFALPEEMFSEVIWPMLVRSLLKNHSILQRAVKIGFSDDVVVLIAVFKEATVIKACQALSKRIEAASAGRQVHDYVVAAENALYSQPPKWPVILDNIVSKPWSGREVQVSAHLRSPIDGRPDMSKIKAIVTSQEAEEYNLWRESHTSTSTKVTCNCAVKIFPALILAGLERIQAGSKSSHD